MEFVFDKLLGGQESYCGKTGSEGEEATERNADFGHHVCDGAGAQHGTSGSGPTEDGGGGCPVCSYEPLMSPLHMRKEHLYGEHEADAIATDSCVSEENHNWLIVQHCPNCNASAALRFLGKWYPVEDCLKSSDTTRHGLQEVTTYAERVVLYILTKIIFQQERSDNDDHQLTFLCPGPTEFAKIFWVDGQAAGFYTMKLKGSPYTGCGSDVYQMPVLDLIYIRKLWRRQGLATGILLDVVHMFPQEDIGLSEPVSENMFKVLSKFLEVHSEWRDYLWEVSWTGGEGFRNNLWLLLRRLRKEKYLR